MNSTIDLVLTTIIYLASTFFLFFLGKMTYQLVNRKINITDELVEKDNLAFAVAHVGYFVGLLLAIGGAIIGPSHGLVEDLIDIFVYGIMAIILLNLSVIINAKIILRKFSVYDEITRDQNVGTGVVEAANAIATGLIILGAVSGEGGDWLTALVFWITGQILIILTSFIYNWIVPYDIHEHIEKDNVAVGIGFAGALIAIANLIRSAIMHDFVSWQDSFLSIGIQVTVGLLFLPIARLAADKILLTHHKLTDELIHQEKPNIGAGLIEAFAYIGGSVLISWCL
jgi:uncharacterized membrane protein YjfL (UPF0719 family)